MEGTQVMRKEMRDETKEVAKVVLKVPQLLVHHGVI